MTVLHSMRLRVLGVVIGLTLAAIGVLSWMALPVLPVVGVAVATAAVVVNSMTSRLGRPVCRDCGQDLSSEPTGPYGVACSGCGRINQSGSRQADAQLARALPPLIAGSEDATTDGLLAGLGVPSQTEAMDQDPTKSA